MLINFKQITACNRVVATYFVYIYIYISSKARVNSTSIHGHLLLLPPLVPSLHSLVRRFPWISGIFGLAIPDLISSLKSLSPINCPCLHPSSSQFVHHVNRAKVIIFILVIKFVALFYVSNNLLKHSLIQKGFLGSVASSAWPSHTSYHHSSHSVQQAACVSIKVLLSLFLMSTWQESSFSFNYSPSTSSSPLQLLFLDVWGPASITSINNKRFYFSIVDDFSKYTWLFPLAIKSEMCATFLRFKQLVETFFNTKRFPWIRGIFSLAIPHLLSSLKSFSPINCLCLHKSSPRFVPHVNKARVIVFILVILLLFPIVLFSCYFLMYGDLPR
jgi:hypothetical protein